MGGKPSMPKQRPPVQVLEPEEEGVEEEIRKRYLAGGRSSTVLTDRAQKGRDLLG